MIIKSFEVMGLFDKDRKVEFRLHDDLNIITGYNGSGKTTVMKLLWYIISGNIHVALREIKFKKCTLQTDAYRLQISRVSNHTCEAVAEDANGKHVFVDTYDEDSETDVDARDMVKEFTEKYGSSLFFPTFRRIEGGFTVEDEIYRPNRNALAAWTAPVKLNELQEAVAAVSRRLSNGAHRFVTSIATTDISELIQQKYTELSEQANATQRKTNEAVIYAIQSYKKDEGKGSKSSDIDASELLNRVKTMIEGANEKRNSIMTPLMAIQDLVTKIFRHSGIKMSGRVSFGDAANAISSDKLSAGEKQMLSFICYNAMTQNSVVFIDEPELSLHVDWQRTLFPTLMSQGKHNQFIIATHSPFIFTKYLDKEIALHPSRGDEGSSE